MATAKMATDKIWQNFSMPNCYGQNGHQSGQNGHIFQNTLTMIYLSIYWYFLWAAYIMKSPFEIKYVYKLVLLMKKLIMLEIKI